MAILMPENARLFGLTIRPTSVILVGSSGDRLPMRGETHLNVSTKTKSTTTTALVVTNAGKNLLGRSEIVSLGLLKQCSFAEAQFDPIQEFPKLSTGLGTMPGVFKINLRENAVPYCLYVPRTIPAGL